MTTGFDTRHIADAPDAIARLRGAPLGRAARRFPDRFRRASGRSLHRVEPGCKAAHGELRLCTLEEMEQAIRRGSRGRKPTKAVTFDEAEEPAERRRRKTANQ